MEHPPPFNLLQIGIWRRGGRWPSRLEFCLRRAVSLTWNWTRPPPANPSTPRAPLVDVHLVSDQAIKQINAQNRKINRVTDVLSFPTPTSGWAEQQHLGDIIVACQRSRRDARHHRCHWIHHIERLVVHGMLHLRGYDHDDRLDAKHMERLEQRLGIALRLNRGLS